MVCQNRHRNARDGGRLAVARGFKDYDDRNERALLGGATAPPFLAAKRGRIESGDFEDPDFPLRWLQKDLHLAAVSAYETGAPMPLTNVAKEIYRLAMRAGRGSADFSAIYDYLAQHRDTP